MFIIIKMLENCRNFVVSRYSGLQKIKAKNLQTFSFKHDKDGKFKTLKSILVEVAKLKPTNLQKTQKTKEFPSQKRNKITEALEQLTILKEIANQAAPYNMGFSRTKTAPILEI